MSKFKINRMTIELIRAILRFRSSFLAPMSKENNIQLRKGLDTVESLSAGAARDPNRNMGSVIIIYIFVTFTHSNIDFHKLIRRISGTLHSSLSCYILRHTY